MRKENLLQVLLILFLIPLTSCSVKITEAKGHIDPGSKPQIRVRWTDTLKKDTSKYELTLTRTGTEIPNLPSSSPKKVETNYLSYTFSDLDVYANYTIKVAKKNDLAINDVEKTETPRNLAPLAKKGEIVILMTVHPTADSSALLGYKLMDPNLDPKKFSDLGGKLNDVRVLFSNITDTSAEVTVNNKLEKLVGSNWLVTGSTYIFTQRFNISGTYKYYEWSDPIIAPHELSEDDLQLVAAIVGVTAAIIGIAFFVICCFNWKYSLRYRPKPKKGKPLPKLVTDPAIPVCEDDFFDHLCQMKLHNFKGFYEEFSSIKKNEFQSSEAFRDPDNQHKNRYVNIPCYDDTRVQLKGTDNVDTYIHANFVPGAYNDNEYIYTQSPLPETVDDFWSMVWQQGCDIIVMIGQLVEKDKQECADYFPDRDDTPLKSHCEVKLVNRHKTADYIVRTLLLSKDEEQRKISHYQYHGWPTNKMTPEYPTSFLRMILRISQSISERPERTGKPIVVHGTNDRHGRAGIYACIDSQIQRFLLKADLSVYGSVVTCTKSRHDGVKTLDEYIFIHDAISEAVLLNDIRSITVDGLPKYIEDAYMGGAKKNKFVSEFDFLTSPPMSSTQKMADASQTYNTSKNRVSNVKPYDYNRVKLKKLKNKEGSDYINASYIDTYKQIRSFIVAQAPLVETIADFWRMINENKSWVIVMLGQEIEGGQLKANRFWPDEGNAMKLDNVTIKFDSISRDTIRDVWIRKMELIDEKGERQNIQFYQYQEWPTQKEINSQTIRSLIELISESKSWKKKLNADFITVVSSSGIGRPGVLTALISLQEEADMESSVDVFRAVHQLNQQRLGLVQTKEEYALTYTATLEITEEARRRPVIQEEVNVDKVEIEEYEVGSTLGIDLKTSSSIEIEPSVEEDSSESEKPADIIEDVPKEATKDSSGVRFQTEDETDVKVKRPLGRQNTQSHESKL